MAGQQAQQGQALQPWYDYPITQGFGVNAEKGVDLGTPLHTPLYAPYGGVKEEAGYHSYGGMVGILASIPGLGRVTEYFAHVDVINPAILNAPAGTTIPAGSFIGWSGGELPGTPGGVHPASTGSTGEHTEFGFFTGRPWVSPSVDPTGVVQALRGQDGQFLRPNSLGSSSSNQLFDPWHVVSSAAFQYGADSASGDNPLQITFDTLTGGLFSSGRYKDVLWRLVLIVGGLLVILIGIKLFFAHEELGIVEQVAGSPAGQQAVKAAAK